MALFTTINGRICNSVHDNVNYTTHNTVHDTAHNTIHDNVHDTIYNIISDKYQLIMIFAIIFFMDIIVISNELHHVLYNDFCTYCVC